MNQKLIETGKYRLTALLPEAPCEGIIYIPSHGDAEAIAELLPRPRAALVFISGFDWNRDLSPWPAKAVFGDEDFGGQADAFLDILLREIIPAAERACGFTPRWRGIAGYSLAGLFAAYAVCRTDAFTRVASVSGSMWYDGWMDYARIHIPVSVTRAYFSVGAKEKKTRNVRMQSVEENTRAMHELFLSRGVKSAFELNPGNHFVDMEKRMSRAIEFLTE